MNTELGLPCGRERREVDVRGARATSWEQRGKRGSLREFHRLQVPAGPG